mgnify:CR=1 FL=1
MKVTNATKSVVNYKGRAYGPNAAIELAEGDEKRGDIGRMLGDGRLSVSLAGDNTKPSDGLNVDELKKALTEKGVAFDASLKKADLAALLDAQ